MKINQCYDRQTVMATFPGVDERQAFNLAGGGVVLMLLEANTYGYANAIQKQERELWMQINPAATADNAALKGGAGPLRVFLKRRNTNCYVFLGEASFTQSLPDMDFFAFTLDPTVESGHLRMTARARSGEFYVVRCRTRRCSGRGPRLRSEPRR